MPPAARRERTGHYLAVGVQVLFVAAAYYLAAKIGLRLALVRGQVTPMWPPTGIALACLLLLGIRCWPGITIGAFLANVAYGPAVPATVAIAAGNTIAPVVAFLLLRGAGFRPDLKRLKDVLALIALGAFAGMVLSATVGTVALVVSGALPTGEFWAAWSVWWVGDAMGVLVVAPVLLVVATARLRGRMRLRRLLEAVVLIAGLTVLVLVVTRSSAHLLFLVFPMLIWAAFRFQQLGAAPCNLVVSSAMVLAAVAGHGPFAGLGLLPTMITLHLFNGAATLTALLLAAIIDERNEAQRSVEHAVAQLSDAVRRLEPYSLLRDSLLTHVARGRGPRPSTRRP